MAAYLEKENRILNRDNWQSKLRLFASNVKHSKAERQRHQEGDDTIIAVRDEILLHMRIDWKSARTTHPGNGEIPGCSAGRIETALYSGEFTTLAEQAFLSLKNFRTSFYKSISRSGYSLHPS